MTMSVYGVTPGPGPGPMTMSVDGVQPGTTPGTYTCFALRWLGEAVLFVLVFVLLLLVVVVVVVFFFFFFYRPNITALVNWA